MKIAGLVGLAIGAAGCLQSNINGGANGSGGLSSGTPEVTAGASGASSSGGIGPAGNGPGASNGTSSGTGRGGGVASETGGSTTQGQGTSNGGIASGTAAGTTGGRLPDAGCLVNMSNCQANQDCCSGSCDGTCAQGGGQGCLLPQDCTSMQCINQQCACSRALGSCGANADCCSGPCTHFEAGGRDYGECCADVGGTCSSPGECCTGDCSNGQCQCLALGAFCSYVAGCCSGICVNGTCRSGPGSPCTDDSQCDKYNCDNGTCGTCGKPSAACAGPSDCCSGSVCGASLELLQSRDGPPVLLDAGSQCYTQIGGPCSPECPGYCDPTATTCRCGTPLESCGNSATCCSGGACMVGPGGGTFLYCCQVTGQVCYSADECCTDYCGPDDRCACMPAGGACGPVGTVSGLGEAACCSGTCGDAGTCL